MSPTEDTTGFDKIVMVLFVLIVGYIGVSLLFNQPISSILSGSPDKSCRQDSDCVLRVTTCHACNCGEAVNKNWKPFCLIKSAANECKLCDTVESKFEVNCMENQCQKVPK